QTVEEDGRKRHRRTLNLDVDARAEATHRHLERMRPPVRAQRDDLPVEHDALDGKSQYGVDDLGHAIGDVRQAARECTHLRAETMHLESRSVELPFDGSGPR